MSEWNNYFVKLNTTECETDTKNKSTYVSWSDAWTEVKKAYPESNYIIYENADGFPFWESKFGIDCKVWVTINGIEHIVRLPVMNGANKAMKADAYTYTKKGWKWWADTEVAVEAATQFDINKTTQRAFAKAIAMHGIWLYVFRWEDLPEEPPTQPKEPFTHIHLNWVIEWYNESGSEWASDFMSDYPNVEMKGKGMFVVKSLKAEYTANQNLSDEFNIEFKADAAKREAKGNF